LHAASYVDLIQDNGSHHPARATKATMSKTADRVLGVHGFVIRQFVESRIYVANRASTEVRVSETRESIDQV